MASSDTFTWPLPLIRTVAWAGWIGSDGPQEDGTQVAGGQGDGVALHAAGSERLGGDVVGVLGPDAERAEAGYLQQGEGLADPGEAVLDGRAGLPGQQLSRLMVPVQGGLAGRPGPQRPHVALDDGYQQRGAGHAVR